MTMTDGCSGVKPAWMQRKVVDEMKKTVIWHSTHPHEIGWWPASIRMNNQEIRWWNGKFWSLACDQTYDRRAAGATANIPCAFSEEILWTERWWV